MAESLKRSREDLKRRSRIVELVESLPEATAEPCGRQQEHVAFKVRKKTFAYYLFDHHGDGRIALWCKAAAGEQGKLVKGDPDRYFVPAYLGPRGWVGLRLDRAKVDWNETANLI